MLRSEELRTMGTGWPCTTFTATLLTMTSEMESEPPWEQLFEQAETLLADLLRSLPQELRAEAERVPCLLEKWPPEGDDALGRCLSFEEHVISQAPGPFVLYLGTIYRACIEHGLDFLDEVRVTYLHELGHHLGLDEDDLAERGLE